MSAARDAALARVGAKSQPTARPALDPAVVGAFLDACGLTDLQGRRPSDPGWDGPWDENLVIAEVYASKAAAVAGDFNFSADGASYNKGDLLAKFLELEQQYRSRSGAAGGLGTTTVAGTNDPYTLDAIAQRVIP